MWTVWLNLSRPDANRKANAGVELSTRCLILGVAQLRPMMRHHLKRLFKLLLMSMPERYAYAIFDTLCARYDLIGGIKSLPGGQAIEGSVRDFGVFVPLMRTGTYSGAADELFDEYFKLSSHGTYIDIGANVGITTIPYALKHTWDFHAFEPDPDHFRRLQCNLIRNGINRVRAHNVALYDKAGTLDLRKSPVNFGDYRLAVGASPEANNWKIAKIRTETLDNLLSVSALQKPIIIKIDTQGAEPFIWRGGKSVIAAADVVLTELDPRKISEMGNDPMEFFDSLHAIFPNAKSEQRNAAEIRNWIAEVVARGSKGFIDVLFRR
jgi:FkbM family methyltransferase